MDETRTLDETVSAVDTGPSAPARRASLPPDGMLGRYHVLDVLGAGGMGVVYLARDPVLDRTVALKVVHRNRVVAGGQARLVHEAKAMARLQHPNVVAVHDVDLVDGQVVVSMERVEGRTLRRWLDERPRHWREVVTAFAAAGRGLAAAHAARIVHRDFKPENVLVADDGRVRVADFGLARSVPDDGADPAAIRVTAPALGTPLFMAPEQHDGGAVTAAADQYAFCVALWKAALGVWPFAGTTTAELAAAKRSGRVVEPRRIRAPRWLVALLRRGLAVEPAARHASMDVVVAALETGLGRRRRALLAVGAVALVGAGAGASLSIAPPAADPCTGGEARVTAAWPRAARRAAIERVAGLGGDTLARRLDGDVGAFATRWVAGYRDACLAHDRGAQSAELLDRRMVCLERGRAGLGAVADVVARADASTLPQIPLAVQALPDPAACDDAEALLAAVPLPPRAQAARAAPIRAAVERALVRVAAGRLAEAQAEATTAVADARALGYAPLLARALLAEGRAVMGTAERERAAPPLAEAMRIALEARDDTLAVEAWARRAWVLGTSDVRERGEALDGFEVVGALAARAPSPSFERALLFNNVGVVALAADRVDDARTWLTRALTESRGVTGPGVIELINVRSNLAMITEDAERRDAILAEAESELAGRIGADHPQTLHVRLTRGVWSPRLTDAAELLAGACEGLDAQADARDPAVECWAELGFIADELGDRARAIAAVERAAARAVPTVRGAEAAGYVALWRGDARGAIATFATELAALPRRPDEPFWRPVSRGKLALGLGRAQRAAGDARAARDAFEAAVDDLAAATRVRPGGAGERRLTRARAELQTLVREVPR